MKMTSRLICIILLFLSFQASAIRSMYVNDFASILGDQAAENELLSYSQSNGIEALLLYELHIVNANYTLSNASSNGILADFISKAKTNYGILNVGAVAENGDFFTNVVDAYNNSRTNANEKFDTYNLEFEFWLQSSTDPGGYYCTTYLTPNGFPCTNDGAFQFFVSTLQTMNSLAANNSHPITTETYVGWPTALQAEIIGNNVDRVLLHAYVSDPNTAFAYSENRMIDFANGNPGLDVSIIYSSEPTFMQNWLVNNSMNTGETIYTNDWQTGSNAWSNNINLVGFTYFAYGFNQNVTLSAGEQLNSERLSAFPNPVQNTLYIENEDVIELAKLYDNLGRLILETKTNTIDFTGLSIGIYSLQIFTENGMIVKKILKK